MATKKIPVKIEKKSVPAKASVTKIVRAPRPAAKTIEKGAATQEASKTGVSMLKKVQTAEGWKREALKQHQIKKQTKS